MCLKQQKFYVQLSCSTFTYLVQEANTFLLVWVCLYESTYPHAIEGIILCMSHHLFSFSQWPRHRRRIAISDSDLVCVGLYTRTRSPGTYETGWTRLSYQVATYSAEAFRWSHTKQWALCSLLITSAMYSGTVFKVWLWLIKDWYSTMAVVPSLPWMDLILWQNAEWHYM